jgi:hypothetical protein
MRTKEAPDDDGSTDQLVEIPVRPPRDPAAYRPTDHFLQRHRERVPEFDKSLPRRVIETGQASRVRGAAVADASDYGTPIAFTTAVRGEPWTVVVALRPVAFVDSDTKHRALTLYQGTPTRTDESGGGGEQ